MQVKTTVEPLHNGHHGDRRKWPLWGGGRYREVAVMGRLGGNMTIFFREYNMFIVLSSCLLYPIVVIQSYIITI